MPCLALLRTSRLLLTLVFPLCGAFHAFGQEAKQEDDPALKQYFIANGAYNRKLYPVAIQQYEEFLKDHPTHPKADLARRGLALSYYASQQYKEAIAPLAALLAQPKLDETVSRERLVMMQGQCLLLTSDPDRARAHYVAELATLKTDEYRTAALASICDVSFGKAEWPEVLKWSVQLLAAKTAPEQTARALYQQGYAHYQSHDPDAAIASLGKITALEADQVWKTRASYLLGECLNRQKEYGKAEAAFVAALPGLEGKDATECRYRLGLTRFVLAKYEEATADLDAYLAAAPDGAHAAEAKLHVARAWLERGEYGKAAPLLTALAAGQDELAARASLWLARVSTRPEKKDYTKASEVLATAVATFSESPVADDLRFDYANALMARSEPDWTTALEMLQLVETGGKFAQMAEVVRQRAVCQQKLEDYEGSLASNDQFLATFAGHPLAGEALLMRAENLFLLGRLDDSAKAYGDFLAKQGEHPGRTAAAYRLAQIHHAQGRWAECLAAATPLLAAKPKDPLYAQLPFLVGDSLFRQEKWSDAIAPLEAFLAPRIKTSDTKGRTVTADPNVDTALMQLAVASDRLGQPDQALDHLLTLVSHYPAPSPQLPLALAEQGRLAFESGNMKIARDALARFITSDQPENEIFAKHAPAQRSRVLYYLGWVEATDKNFPAAAARFAEVAKLDPDHPLAPDAGLQQGIALLNAGRYDLAAAQFANVLQQYPGHPKLDRVVFHAGLALARQKDWELAAAQFKRLAEDFAESEFAGQALYEWAWCERAANRMPAATALYEQLLATHPESPLAVKVQSELAELNLDAGAQDKVIAQLSATMQTVKDPALREEIRYQLASAHFKKADHKTAATQFEELLKDYPKSKLLASMHFQAGESQLQLKQTAAALAHFSAAARIPDSPPALVESITMRLAETQALTGTHAEAAKSYASFLEKFPESKWSRNARFGFALATEQSGNPAAALADYEKLLAGSVTDLWTVRSRYQSGVCHLALNQIDQAIVDFVSVEISYPQYPAWQAQAVLQIGRTLLAQKKTDPAKERFEDVLARFPKEAAAVEAKKQLAALAGQ